MRIKLILVALLVIGLAVCPLADDKEKAAKNKINEDTFSGLKLRNIGPALMSGRIVDIAVHPGKKSTWLVAVGSGNVWKTENAGTTWKPVFDNQTSYSIGCVTIDPNNPEVYWVGTGENVSGRHVGFGDGVYKSEDGGETWTNMGLKKSEHIAKIIVHPKDSNVIYVAAEGPLWNEGGERGVYKSLDGGKTWKAVLEISKDTGVTSLEMDPTDPDVLYAAAYQRRRSVAILLAGGPESGIHKSTDGGQTWIKLENGLPRGDVGKIGLAVSPINPQVVYATVEAKAPDGGFFRSANGGLSWERRNEYRSGGTGPHYYQEIYAHPSKFDWVFQMDPMMRVTEDGGKTFRPVGEQYKHVDNHAIAFDKDDPEYLLVGCDGGLYESFDGGKEWKYFENLPVTQFYKLSLDNAYPFYNIVGGTQDNNTQVGPSRTFAREGIRNDDWFITVGGDGYDCAFDPEDPNIIYSEWQNGGLMRYDKRTGENVDIQPQPAPDQEPNRFNWDAPVIVSPHNSKRLYYGSQVLWKSDDRGDTWKTISPDLSRGIERLKQEIMGKQHSYDALWDMFAMSKYSNLTTISESPLVEGLIYCGTDDGLIQITEDDGKTWRKVEKIEGIPEMTFVTKLYASFHENDVVYALFDNHKRGDFKPYMMKSADRGRTWSSIVGDMPDRHLLWSVVQDHVKKELLFAATEFGIFFTIDEGKHWVRLKGDAPTIAFRDIEIQRRENDLVGGSFGRGFFILDDYSPLRLVTAEMLEKEAELFPVKKTLMFNPRSIERGARGAQYYTAPNPPAGAVFTYYLKDDLKTAKAKRQEAEAELVKEGKDTPYPAWETLKAEDREEEPRVVLTVRDEQGNLVNTVEGPATKGFNRVVWDFRHQSKAPVSENSRRFSFGYMAMPGKYLVSMALHKDGVVTPLGEAQPFETEPVGMADLDEAERAEVAAFQKKTVALQRVIMGTAAAFGAAQEELEALKKALELTPVADPALLKRARELELKFKDASEKLYGSRLKAQYGETDKDSIMDRFNLVVYGHWGITGAPTNTFRQNLKYAEELFAPVYDEIRELVEVDLAKLKADAEAAGAPWSPGRDVPKMR